MAKGRALFILSALFSLRAFAGPISTTPAPDYGQIGPLDQAAGRTAIAQFRQAGIPGSYYMEFALRFLPRRGEEQVVHGRLWGSRNEQGSVLKFVLNPGAANERRWLLQVGPEPAAWSRDGRGATRSAQLLEPLWDHWEMTPFDLEMPMIALYWPDETLLSVNRLFGRPANAFLFRPPAAFAAQHPEIHAVRSYFDTEYDAPRQTELVGANGRTLKTWICQDLKKIAEIMVPKEFDVRNETTRDKTRLDVTGAAMNLPRSPAFFEPARLADALDPQRPPGFVDFGD